MPKPMAITTGRHVGNAVVKNDSRGHRIVKEYKDTIRPIDLAVTAVMTVSALALVGAARLPLGRSQH
jgi:hypothetical protein